MDTSGLKYPKGLPGIISRRVRAVEQERLLAAAYAAVNLRDQNRCAVTGVPLSPYAMHEKSRREHHHLVGRRIKPEWRTDPRRIILVSAYAHKLITANALITDQFDAQKPIVWRWNYKIVKPGEELFRLSNASTLQRKD